VDEDEGFARTNVHTHACALDGQAGTVPSTLGLGGGTGAGTRAGAGAGGRAGRGSRDGRAGGGSIQRELLEAALAHFEQLKQLRKVGGRVGE
jgi:hypothetical protein